MQHWRFNKWSMEDLPPLWFPIWVIVVHLRYCYFVYDMFRHDSMFIVLDLDHVLLRHWLSFSWWKDMLLCYASLMLLYLSCCDLYDVYILDIVDVAKFFVISSKSECLQPSKKVGHYKFSHIYTAMRIDGVRMFPLCCCYRSGSVLDVIWTLSA